MKALQTYFILHHKTYSGQHNQCSIRTAHEENVGRNTIKYTTSALLYSDWLHFIWHGKNYNNRIVVKGAGEKF